MNEAQIRAELLAQGEDIALNDQQARAWTDMSKTRLYQEIREGRLKCRRKGARTFFLPSDTRSWLRGETQGEA